MSRLARAISQSGVYHIIFRGVNQQNLFEEKADFEKLKDTIQKVKLEMGFQIYAYCFMRTSKTVNNAGVSTSLSYIYNGTNLVYELQNNTETTYLRGYELISRNTAGAISYYITDNHGDVSKVIDGNATALAEYTYDAYGNVQTTSTDTNPFRYCGEYYDEETGLIYLRNRYYDPGIGRFISEDPIKDGLNWYAYCNGNPVMYVDPSGLADEDRLGKGIWSLKNDDQGVEILAHWLFENGEELVKNNGSWGSYMKNNDILKSKVKDLVLPLSDELKFGESKDVNITTSMEIENGEDIIGYQYLHGTNADVGGFHIEGTIIKDEEGNVTYDLTYTWNDKIDPNFMYTSDSKKAEFAKSIPLANPTDYIIRISWDDKTVIKATPCWFNWSKGWLK